jgi:hypothetical protein
LPHATIPWAEKPWPAISFARLWLETESPSSTAAVRPAQSARRTTGGSPT